MTCKALYAKLIKQTQTKKTSPPYWEQIIRNADDEYHAQEIDIDWKKICLIPRRATIKSYTRSFQYKITNNALFLNKKLFNIGHVESPACSFCNQDEESLMHFSCECHVNRKLWKDLQRFFAASLELPELNLKNAFFGYVPVTTSSSNNKQVDKLINHIILIFKRSLYEMRSSRTSPSVLYVARRVKQIMEIEYQIAQTNCKLSLHFDKWEPLVDTL